VTEELPQVLENVGIAWTAGWPKVQILAILRARHRNTTKSRAKVPGLQVPPKLLSGLLVHLIPLL